jgi:hypothetical protein
MSAFKTDGTFTSASAVGAARKSFPFDGDNSSFIVEQDYMIALSSFSPLALSTALQDLGGGIVKWTRTYAQIPATRSEYSTFAYTFIGFLGAGIAPYSQYDIQAGDQRDPFLKVVMSRVYNEYFLCATGQTYTTPSAIPVINAQSYNFDGLPNNKVNYLVDPAINPLSTATEPTLPDYRDMVTAGDEIVAEDSTLERWMGNIYVRSTRYVKAL